MKYFAYGSNMAPDVISDLSPSHKLLGPAKLKDFRLSFTRKSKNWGGGVADIVYARDLTVWGVLFEIGEDDLESIDQKEGLGRAYERIELDVLLEGKIAHRTTTYTVKSKESQEVPPTPSYLETLVQGARSQGLPENYVAFLEDLRKEDTDRFREGFLLVGTESRLESSGMNIVKISRHMGKRLRLGNLAAVVHNEKACLAKVVYVRAFDGRICQVDQSIRQALGIPGRECYGAVVSLRPVSGKGLQVPFVKPRCLILSLYRSSRLDMEKNICVLHPDNIRLLGLDEGEYVAVRIAGFDENTKYKIKQHTLRVFGGTASVIDRDGLETTEYPKPNELYLDLDGRLRLGVPKDAFGIPVIVSASISKLFASRLLYYGITLFLSMVAISPLVQEVLSVFGISQIVGLGIALLLSTVITLMFCLFDIRGKIQY
jgi:gamma-glutamylcyclotransferase